MKKLLLLCFALCFWGCQSDEPVPMLVGDWLWQSSYSYGCFSSYRQVANPAEPVVLSFRHNGSFTLTKSNVLIAKGAYSLKPAEEYEGGKKKLMLSLQPDTTGTQGNPTALYLYQAAGFLEELSPKKMSVSSQFGTTGSGSEYTRRR